MSEGPPLGTSMAGPTRPFLKMSLKRRRTTERWKAYTAQVKESRLAHDKALYGSLGGASPVRRIDPKTGGLVEVLDPETGAVLEPKIGRAGTGTRSKCVSEDSMENTTAVKRSITVSCHKTSISLEDPFWDALIEIAQLMNMPVERLVEQIDEASGPDLSSAIRIYVLTYLQMALSSRNTIDAAGDPGEDAECRLIT